MNNATHTEAPSTELIGACCFCEEEPEFEMSSGEGNEFEMCGCCEDSHEARSFGGWSWEEVYGISLAETAQAYGINVRKTVEGAGSLRYSMKLSSRVEKSRNLVKDYIRTHHSHNSNPPAADRSRFVCFNGPSLVGVAMVGNPVSRTYAKANPGTVEVTRVCVGAEYAPDLRRNACTKLYAEAFKWARKAGFQTVITFTRDDENGTSCKAAGFIQDPTHNYKGGSFANRAGRTKVDAINKIRWIKEL